MRKMRKFAKGGSADRAQSRYDRMTKDIESDYEKAKSRKTGRALEVAKAKYEQRMADARDDRAKARGEDRTATRAAEKAAERNLSTTRRYGASKTAAAVGASEPIAKPMSTSQISEAVASKPAATPTPAKVKPTPRTRPMASASRPGTTRRAAAPASTPAPTAVSRAPEMKDTREIVVEGRRRDNTAAGRRARMANVLKSIAAAPIKYSPLVLAARAIFDEAPSKKAGGKITAKGHAKGGKIDGAAVRGKTRAKRK